MVDLYSVVVIQPKLRGTTRENLEHCLQLIDGMVMYASLEVPPKIVAFPEFFLQAARGAHRTDARALPRQIHIPGEETELLGEKAKKHGIYIIGTAEAFEPEWPGYSFNIAFVIGPNGQVIHKYYKHMTTCNLMEMNVGPHDIYDKFVAKYGDDLSAFFPVCKTEIGNIGIFTCYDGNFPEIPRALALNGAEVLVRPAAWPEPYINEPMEYWHLQNRMRAIENVAYLVAPSQGGGGYMGTDITACPSMIVDYKGRILAQANPLGESSIYCTINIEELRRYRQVAKAYNFLPALRSEIFAKIYEVPIWPRNRWASEPPKNLGELQSTWRESVEGLRRRGVFHGE